MTTLTVATHPLTDSKIHKEAVRSESATCSWCGGVGSVHRQNKERRLWRYQIRRADGTLSTIPGLYCGMEHMLGGAAHTR